ncbi:MAG TPA: ABC transporter permease subunit [Methylocella sp.]|nr:ABC transporter permease subunit [Methylocella sp.]
MNEPARAAPLSVTAAATRNWPMRTSLAILGLITILCLIGPLLSGHPYDQVYRDYVLVPPSLFAHPFPVEIEDAKAAIARRMHVRIEGARVEGDALHVTLGAGKRIDPRALRAFARSDLFAPAKIAAAGDDGRRLTIDVPLKRMIFLFGTDANGRDLFTRVLIAGRISLAVGLLASFIALTIGVAYGAAAGYAGGQLDSLMMRAVEIIYALPFIFFVIVLVMVFGRHFVLIFLAIGAVEWLDMARIVRGQTLSIKQRDFVAAAEALGATTPAILWRHVIPNAAGPIVAYLTMLVPRVILLESFVSFLGLGVQEPLTSWGVLVADGARNIQGSIHLLIFPALFLGATLGALQGLGDGWRRAGIQ